MQCIEFEQRLQGLLDARKPITEDRELVAHALQCDACDAMLQAYQVIEQHVCRLAVRPSRDIAPAVVPVVARPRSVNLSKLVTAGLAAALLWIAILPLIRDPKIHRTVRETPSARVAGQQHAVPAGQAIRDAGSHWWGIAHSTAQPLAGVSSLIDPPDVNAVQEALVCDASNFGSWYSWQDRLKPIVDAAGNTIQLLGQLTLSPQAEARAKKS